MWLTFLVKNVWFNLSFLFLQSFALGSNSAKRHSSTSTPNTETKVKTKKLRLNASSAMGSCSTPKVLTTLGLMNNHVSPLRKNNTLLDRPEVLAPVNMFI